MLAADEGGISSPPPGERQVLAAVVALLERLHGCAASNLEFPDEAERQAKAIDLRLNIGDVAFALEHTSIDYSPAARRVADFWRRVDPQVFARVLEQRRHMEEQRWGGQWSQLA